MDAVERDIAAYRSAPFDANGEAWGKIAALIALEKLLPDSRVLDFFLAIAADPTEYDMARVHLLKLFEAEKPPVDDLVLFLERSSYEPHLSSVARKSAGSQRGTS